MRRPLFCVHLCKKEAAVRRIFIAWLRFSRGRPVKASRYALRVSRSVVITLSLLRRNAASESKAACELRPANCELRAALWDGPYA